MLEICWAPVAAHEMPKVNPNVDLKMVESDCGSEY